MVRWYILVVLVQFSSIVVMYWSTSDDKTDPYRKHNLQPKAKLGANFVFTSPYVGNRIRKTCTLPTSSLKNKLLLVPTPAAL